MVKNLLQLEVLKLKDPLLKEDLMQQLKEKEELKIFSFPQQQNL